MRWSHVLLAAALALPAFAETAPSGGKDSLSNALDKTVDAALVAIRQREEMQMVDGIRPVDHIVLPGPGGRTALAYARETPDGMVWPLIILIPGATTGKSPSVAVESVYETLKAHRIGRMEWSEDGFYLAVLTQATSLTGPGGDLVVAMPGTGHAKRIDRDVVSFSMSKDGRWLLYEKMKTTDDHTGPRQLMVSDGATGQRKLVADVPFPKEQVAALGIPDTESNKAKVTLRDYSAGLANPKDIESVVDLLQARLTK